MTGKTTASVPLEVAVQDAAGAHQALLAGDITGKIVLAVE